MHNESVSSTFFSSLNKLILESLNKLLFEPMVRIQGVQASFYSVDPIPFKKINQYDNDQSPTKVAQVTNQARARLVYFVELELNF